MIVHLPAEEDNSSLEGSESSTHGVSSFVNFGYAAARMAAMNERNPDELDELDELDDIDHDVFFPPPPKGPPPEPPDSDDDNTPPDVFRSDYEKGEYSPEVYRPDYDGDGDGIQLSSSPSDSTTGSTDHLVTGYPNVILPSGSFLRRFSLTEATTEL